MKVLLDTHAFLWFIQGDAQLSEIARNVFMDAENELLLSWVSYWEICLKISVGKLDLGDAWQSQIEREMNHNAIRWLAPAKEHFTGILSLPWLHRDPFDRLLVAQARRESLVILTNDRSIRAYDVRTVW